MARISETYLQEENVFAIIVDLFIPESKKMINSLLDKLVKFYQNTGVLMMEQILVLAIIKFQRRKE